MASGNKTRISIRVLGTSAAAAYAVHETHHTSWMFSRLVFPLLLVGDPSSLTSLKLERRALVCCPFDPLWSNLTPLLDLPDIIDVCMLQHRGNMRVIARSAVASCRGGNLAAVAAGCGRVGGCGELVEPSDNVRLDLAAHSRGAVYSMGRLVRKDVNSLG